MNGLFGSCRITVLAPYAMVLWVLLLVGACSPAQDGVQGPTPTPLPTPLVPDKPRYTVQRGTVVRTVEFNGRISAVVQQDLFFRSDGIVDTVNVAVGDEVVEGDLLAQLDVMPLEAQLAQAELALRRAETILEKAQADHERALASAELALEQAQTALQQTQAGAVSPAVTASEIGVSRAEQALAYWQAEYEKALDRAWEPQESLDNYARQVAQAEENLEIARAEHEAALGQRSADYYGAQLRQYDVRRAELELEQLQEGIDPLLALDVEKARLDVSELRAQLAAAQLLAPFDGRVASLSLQPGTAATAYETVAVIVDPAELEVTADPGSEALRQVSVGMTATVRLQQRPQQPLAGTVRQLPGGLGTTVSANSNEDRFVHVALSDDGGLALGELAAVVITVEQKEDVLWLPPAAIRSFQGRQFVVVQEEAGQRRVDVRPGLEGDGRVEIVEGLEEGEVVVGE
ncbi:MAG: efflux RND transporter periplasmic adaptor subunit [bacterium]